jgi:pSer/pThr/pTyr-binding forkhead associated (FHA) protein
MPIRSRIILYFLAGALAGFLVWAVTEPSRYFEPIFTPGVPFTPLPFERALARLANAMTIRSLIYGAIFGLLLGGGLGASSSLGKSGRAVLRSTLVGMAAGVLCGMIGDYLGNIVYSRLGGNPAEAAGPAAPLGFLYYIWQVAARAAGWAALGFVLGASQGLAERSSKKAWHGMIGGLIGGFIGGAAFNIIGDIAMTGRLSRLIGAIAVGSLIGLLIALVEDVLKTAWVRVVAGRGEGKEYIITKPATTIGRNELSDIGLFGDPRVMATHAVINIVSNRYTIFDQGTPTGTFVNGSPVPSAVLKDGDEIQIGSHRLLFREKATAPQFVMDRDRPPPEPLPPIPQLPGVCPFCGERKDPRTGQCACSPATQAPAPPAPAPIAGPAQAVGGPRLVGTDGPYVGAVAQIGTLGLTIGREAGRDLQLPQDATVSRKHASVVLEGGVWTLRDEGSSNGTWVNGQRVTSLALQPGDTIQIGATKFRFEM